MFPFKAFVKLWRHQVSLHGDLCPYCRTDASVVGWTGFRIWRPCGRTPARRSPNCGNLSAQMVVSVVDPRASAKGSLVAAVVGVVVAGLTFVNAAVAQLSCRGWNTKAFFEPATVADVSRCLKAGAKIHHENEDWGWTPLHSAAAYSKSPEVVKALLDADANIQAEEHGHRHTPLHNAAAYSKSPEVVKVLLDAGANIEARTEEGWTPLHSAAANGKSEAVKALLDAGANIDAQDGNGWTPLHSAAANSRSPSPEVVKALLNAGANPRTKTSDGSTSWDLMRRRGHLKGTTVYWLLMQAH